MNTTISNNGLPLLPKAPNGQGNAASSATGTNGGEAVGNTAGGDDRVQLTDSARALQEAARTDSGATVDTKKVEQVRQALANGTYKIDPSRIADRMLAMENKLKP